MSTKSTTATTLLNTVRKHWAPARCLRRWFEPWRKMQFCISITMLVWTREGTSYTATTGLMTFSFILYLIIFFCLWCQFSPLWSKSQFNKITEHIHEGRYAKEFNYILHKAISKPSYYDWMNSVFLLLDLMFLFWSPLLVNYHLGFTVEEFAAEQQILRPWLPENTLVPCKQAYAELGVTAVQFIVRRLVLSPRVMQTRI